ncbi:MAG: MerR family transcriptional regulator [Alphaproteobacteria bacterium]|nr:MerR family transcriptional regulator [Alphaproteobacteria bacterium]
MNPDRTRTYTLGELVVESARLLRQIGTSVSDERVSDAPDARAVRYYQGLGLIDRPLRYDGRMAIYGWSHLCRILAVKILQSQGYSLTQIQAAFSAQPASAIEAAVLQALGAHGSPAATPAEPAAPARLHTFELAPGVQLTIDPRVVADPEGLARRIHQLVQGALP